MRAGTGKAAFILLVLATSTYSIGAQQAEGVREALPLPIGPSPPQEDLPLLPDEVILKPSPEEVQPKVPTRYKLELALDRMQPVLPPLVAESRGDLLAVTARVHVNHFTFQGNTAFTDAQLATVLKGYSGREINSEELEEARVALIKHYIEAGFTTSGAILEDQDVTHGVIRFRLVEGRLSRVDLSENRWFRSWWLRNQLRRAAGTPVNASRLKTGLQLLRQNPSISRINAELKPDVRSGESILEVRVKDEQPFRFSFEVSNRRPPSVGEGIGELALADLNLTGHNDPIELRWGIVQWSKDNGAKYSGFDNISGGYEFPITPWDTTLRIRGSKSDSSIIDETFAELGITSRSSDISISIQQPVHHTLTDLATLSIMADRKNSETFLLGRPFSLSNGAINGETDVFALRFSADWVNRSLVHVLALRSVFSLGLYALGSTEAESRPAAESATAQSTGAGIPDSKFVSWLGQVQYVRKVLNIPTIREMPEGALRSSLLDSTLLIRVNGQIADQPMLSLEQFTIGGMQSVRGYRENQLLRDNGFFASAEFRLPLLFARSGPPIVSMAPFFDVGGGWDNSSFDRYQTIYSAGVGLILGPTRHFQAAVYWGHGFLRLNEGSESLQDYGIHFAVSLSTF